MSFLGLYTRYAWRSIQRGGQRSFFAVLCIAVGVASIVALQNTGLAIQDTLLFDARISTGGDIVVTSAQRYFTKDDLAGFERLKQQGVILDYTTRVNSAGFSIKKPDGTESNPSGSFYLALVIDPARYPFYGSPEFEQPSGASLKNTLTRPGQIVLNSKMAKSIEAETGSHLKVTTFDGRIGELEVAGILSDKATGPDSGQAAATGYGYISPPTAQAYFSVDAILPRTVLVKTTGSPADNNRASAAIEALSPNYNAQTSEERNAQVKQGTDGLRTFLNCVGLLSLLIGSLGVVNTMLVVVGRRSTEIATLKALGMENSQTIQMFVIESALLGVLGSLAGVALGQLLSLITTRAAEGLVNRSLAYQVYGQSIVTGLGVGIVTAMVFGLLPAYSASKIPPAQVLRQKVNFLPKLAGPAFPAIIGFMTLIMGLLCGIVLEGNYLLGLIVAFASLLICSLLVLFLSGILWVVGKIPLPLGLNYLLARRNLSRSRGKSAMTMLVMMVGIFAVTLVLILASSLKATIQTAYQNSFNYNLQITVKNDSQASSIQAAFDSKAVPGYQNNIMAAQANVRLISAGGASPDELRKRENARRELNRAAGTGNRGSSSADDAFSNLVGLGLPTVDSFYRLEAGRVFSSDNEALIDKNVSDYFGLKTGDKLIYQDLASQQQFELTVSGIYEAKNAVLGEISSVTVSLAKAQTLASHVTALEVRFDPSQLERGIKFLRSKYPNLDLTDQSNKTNEINSLIDNITAFPVLLALLCLLAGAVLIANNVTLAVMERRVEMGVMKSIGADNQRVLAIINWESGIVGFLGGLFGFSIAALTAWLVVQNFSTADNPGVLALSPLVALGMLALAIGLAVAATLSSAWGAAHEKPLVVLRYD